MTDSAHLETVIRGGTIATAEASFKADIGVRGGRIVAIAEELEGETMIEVDGCIVAPGGVDVHTHFDTTLGEASTADDYESGSRAAAFGGITTYINYAFQTDGESLADAIQREAMKARGMSYLDYSFHPVITRVDFQVLAEFEALRDWGFTSVKVFTAIRGFQSGDDEILAVLRRASETGLMVNVHAEDGPLVDHLTHSLLAGGMTEPKWLPCSRPSIAEGLATEKVAIYGEATGCPIYIVHLSSQLALEAVRRARARGAEIYVETRPIYLFRDSGSYDLPLAQAQAYTVWPPLRSAEDIDALWRAMSTGEIQTIATDHTTWMLAEKTGADLDFASVPGGVSNVETMLGMLFSQGVRTGLLSLERFVSLTSTNPAKLFGIWPRKGTISVGADADIVVIDPERRVTIAAETMQSISDFDPYEGFEATGWPTMTIRRGVVIVQEGQLVHDVAEGQLIKRRGYVRP